ncbi:MAG: DUF4412 domain-containing protein [Chitinophagales bacterium]|nr:DUF4412 domain-containing protein [Chitinophagales bacterium]
MRIFTWSFLFLFHFKTFATEPKLLKNVVLTYKTELGTSIPEMQQLVKNFAQNQITLIIKDDWYMKTETSGQNQGTVLVDNKNKNAYIIYDKTQEVEKATYWTVDGVEGNVDAFIPDSRKTLLNSSNERDTILGYPCIKYEVVKSSYKSPTVSSMYIWVTDSIEIPQTRYEISSKTKVVSPIIPEAIPVSGVVLKLAATENNITLTYTATSLSTKPIVEETFNIPEAYTKIGF